MSEETGAGIDRRALMRRMGLAVLAGGVPASELAAGQPSAGVPAVVPKGQYPKDGRLGPLRDLNGYFPFTPPRSEAVWRKRAEFVRRRILVACGLWPLPDTDPVAATVHGKTDRDEYTVERVFFESAPGLFVTGNLYRPKGAEGRRPTVLCPHGHWANGRFFDHGEEAVGKEIENGAEKFPIGGRYPLQARCVQLARMGCVVFHYDMLGYADSAPFTQHVTHGLRDQRPERTSPERWGLFSAQAELRLISAFGFQTFNSMRVLDWIATLPDVDPERIGVTGASGGGTQTFILAAVDPRPAAAFPAVMVSTAMQGGCTCENACYLRIDTGNIEFAAMCAPRPLGMSAADDWTVELETKGLPEIRQLYELLKVPDRVEGKYFKFGHNYNAVSRAMMYAFFNKHLRLGHDDPIVERDFAPLTRDEMTVWTSGHPKPACDDDAEIGVLRAWDRASEKQRRELVPTDSAGLKKYQEITHGAYEILIGRDLPAAGDVMFEPIRQEAFSGFQRISGLVRNTARNEELPASYLLPERWNGTAVFWLHPEGKSALFQANGDLTAPIASLVRAGAAVGSADLFETGEFRAAGPLTAARSVENPRQIAAYTLGYNHCVFAQRVHDVLTLVGFAKHHEYQPRKIHVVGWHEAAWWAAAACLRAGDAIDRLAVVSDRFRFASITDIRDPRMWPGAVKYGDVPGLLAANAPRPLWIANEGTSPLELVDACYRAANAASAVTLDRGSGERPEDAAPMAERLCAWLLA